MTESIIAGVVTGLVVGIAVAAVGAWVGYKFRRKEMLELWAEEERRRKSDRRREVYERDLKIVTDSMQALPDAMVRISREAKRGLRVGLLAQAWEMVLKAIVVAGSLDDPELLEAIGQLMDDFEAWYDLLDLDTGNAKEGKEKEFRKLTAQTRVAASHVLRQRRHILEEV